MLDSLRAQLATLETFIVTVRDMPSEPIPIGIRLALQMYLQILEDAISVLNSLIEYFDNK